MMLDDCSIDFLRERVLPWGRTLSCIGVDGGHSCLHCPGSGDSLEVIVSHGRLIFRDHHFFEYEQLHDGHGSTLEDEFGMGDVRVAGSSVREHHIAEHQRCLYGGLIEVGRLSFG